MAAPEQDDLEQELALVPKKDSALAPAPPRPTGVSAPVSAGGVNHLAMNCVVPGLGSLVRGNKALGALQLGAAGLGLLLLLSGKLAIGVLVVVAAWIWSVVSGIGFLKTRGMEWK